jgi:TPR repeat protein
VLDEYAAITLWQFRLSAVGFQWSCGCAQVAADVFAQETEAAGFLEKPRPVLLRDRWRDAGFVSDAQMLYGAERVGLEVELAARGVVDAQRQVAYRQLIGLGMEPNPQQAVQAFRDAAAEGDPYGMVNFGLLLLRGEHVKQNFTLAKGLFEKAAQHKVPAAFHALGHLYVNGLGVPVNVTRARSVLILAIWSQL